jgi:two-component system LytT family response regulator
MSNKIKAILVDDEENALSILEIKLTRYFPQIEVIGKYNNPTLAIEKINELKPELLFLDIKMPGLSGFDLLDHIMVPDFELIFVSAYGEYALEAIKKCAIGYILKPIDENELKSAVLNAINKLQSKNSSITSPNRLNKITIPFTNGYVVKDISNIVRCEGFSGYTKLYLMDGEVVTSSYSIGLFNKLLNEYGFILAHRSHLINVHCISIYYNDGILELSNKDQVPVSKQNRTLLLKWIKS